LAQLQTLLLGGPININMGEASHKQVPKASAMSYTAALIAARGIWLAAVLAMCTWLLFAGTPFWRYSSSFSSNLVFLVVAPALLALSSLCIVVLQPVCGKGGQHVQINRCQRLVAHLLPPG
jgi:hypothetical protein